MPKKRSDNRIVLGVSGSIAAIKSQDIVRELKTAGFSVTCVLTHSATKFVSPKDLAQASGNPCHVEIFGADISEMPHIDLARQADLLLVAPASATLLGRFVHALCEDLITLTYLATKAPTLIAPAMHDTMWNHPATQNNVNVLQSRHVKFIGPVKGRLADDTIEIGRMSDPADIVKEVEKVLS